MSLVRMLEQHCVATGAAVVFFAAEPPEKFDFVRRLVGVCQADNGKEARDMYQCGYMYGFVH